MCRSIKYRVWLILYPFFLILSISIKAQNTLRIDTLEKAFRSNRHDTSKAHILHHLSQEYFNGNPKKAMTLAKELVNFSKKINYSKGLSLAYNDIAMYYRAEENYKEALKYDLLNLEINEKRGLPLIIAKSYHSISWTYLYMEDYDKALEFMLKKIKIIRSVDPPDLDKHLSIAFNSIGVIYIGKKQYDSAMKYLDLTQSLIKDNFESEQFADILLNKAIVFEETGCYKQAITEYKKAATICKKLNITYKLPVAYQGLCDLNLKLGNLDSAIFYARRSLDLSLSTNQKIYILYSYESLSKAYKIKNDLKQAIEFLEKAKALKDSINTETIESELSELRIKFETGEKEKEIALLEKNNADAILLAEQRKTILIITVLAGSFFLLLIVFFFYRNKSKKKQLETEFAKNKIELEHKALRAQMNPHFLFNSLNSIQRMFIEGKTDIANDAMADFGNLLRRILNNSGKEIINLKEEIDTLKLYLDIEKMRCDDCFNYEFDTDENIDLINTKVPPLIIQPFVENAIWHGILPKKEKGKIKITISKNTGHNNLLCIVEDDGVGFKNKKNSPHESKGIQITEQRLGKKIIISDLATGGTSVKITIPIS